MYLSSMATTSNKIMRVHKDNPFIEDIQNMLKGTKEYNTEYNGKGQLVGEEFTITYRKRYLPIPFTRIFQNKEVLDDLDPWCCKILIHIALNLVYNQQKIQLTPTNTGLDKRKFSSSIVNLMGRRILVKEKREWYWVNLTLLINGKNDENPSLITE